MKLLDMLTRKKRPKPLGEIRTVRPPGQSRTAQVQAQARQQEALEKEQDKQAIREPDRMFDTGELAMAAENDNVENPYETHTWEMDHDEGLRRVHDSKAAKKKSDRVSGSSGNPYDTIVQRKGW